MTRHLIAYGIILVAVVAVVIAIVRSRRSRRVRHHERINIIDDESAS